MTARSSLEPSMPRMRRQCPPGLPVHVIQRGNNRQICFASDADMKAYANWLYEGANQFDLNIHAWVFMTNHVHLLLTPNAPDSVSRFMQYVGRHYVRYFNYQHQRSGTLYEGRFKSCIVQSEDYLLACQRCIELNPVRAGMVRDPADYLWSSYRGHAFGRPAKMWCPHPEYLALGMNKSTRTAVYRQLFNQRLPNKLISDIRDAVNTGLVLGNDRFRQDVEVITKQRQHHLKRGPKPKTSPS